MSKKIFALLGVMALLVALLPSAVLAAPKLPDYKPVDIGPELRTWEATPDRIAPRDEEEVGVGVALAPEDYPCYVETREWFSLDDYYGGYFFTNFYLIAETETSELWVQADLSYPEGDPRDTPVVTCEQAAYLLSEFDNNMYPVETSFFGTPNFHDGTNSLLEAWGYFDEGTFYNEAGRQVVLVSNVRDDAYYDPEYPNYIAGFYSPAFQAYFDRNIMSIDSHDWANRVGPDGSRPYLYESVFAHEYQHLLHDDYDEDEVNWINEGLSMFSEYLTGYVVNEDSYSTFQELPENSLTAWGDQGGREIVADYGLVFLYHMYLYEKFGQEFIQYEFHNPDNDITSINSTLDYFSLPTTFGDLYHDFAVAVLIDSAMDDYRYGFEALDVGIDVGHPGKPNPEAFASPGAPPWGADYHLLWGYERIANFKFNGYQFNPLSWTSDGDVLWGGAGDLVDNWAIFEAPGGGTLTFDTKFDIEFAWDYGFVQVSTDGGQTWTSLANGDTCSDVVSGAYPTVSANVPGFTGVSGFGCNDPYVEDPYPTAQWITTSFDLSAYAGEDILIAFRYVTDWAYNEPGWHIDNVYIDGNPISDGSSTASFVSLNEVLGISNDYTLLLIGERTRKGKPEYEVQTVMSGGYVSDWTSIRKMFDNYRQLVMVVIYDAPEGVSSYADYYFEMDHRGGKHLK